MSGRSSKVTTADPPFLLVTLRFGRRRPSEPDGMGIYKRQIKDVSRLGCDWEPRRRGNAGKEPVITSCLQLGRK